MDEPPLFTRQGDYSTIQLGKPMGIGGGGGGSVAVKCGGKKAMLPPRGAFVVVVVVTDKECGGNEGGRRRHTRNLSQNLTPVRCAHVPLSQGEGQRQRCPTRWPFLPIGEGEMAGLAAVAAVALAVRCQVA